MDPKFNEDCADKLIEKYAALPADCDLSAEDEAALKRHPLTLEQPALPPAKRLKAWRLGRGLTQRQVAEKLGVPTNTVSRWEQEARALRGLYRRAVEELMSGEGEKR